MLGSCRSRTSHPAPNRSVGLPGSCPMVGPASLRFGDYEAAVRDHQDPANRRRWGKAPLWHFIGRGQVTAHRRSSGIAPYRPRTRVCAARPSSAAPGSDARSSPPSRKPCFLGRRLGHLRYLLRHLQHAVKAGGGYAWPRHQRRQLLHEFQRRHDQMCGAVVPMAVAQGCQPRLDLR